MSPDKHPTLGIFASSQGPGDPERASIMSQAGSYLARRGGRIVCLVEGDDLAVPLITSAKAAGGEVTLIVEDGFIPPSALADVPVERIASHEDRLRRLAQLATVYVALPGSLASAASLYMSWARGGGGPGRKPVVFYDRNGAFRVIRGYAGDIIAESIHGHDRYLQFADSIEDVWNKIAWLVDQGATTI